LRIPAVRLNVRSLAKIRTGKVEATKLFTLFLPKEKVLEVGPGILGR
jgi:hypothetical protein